MAREKDLNFVRPEREMFCDLGQMRENQRYILVIVQNLPEFYQLYMCVGEKEVGRMRPQQEFGDFAKYYCVFKLNIDPQIMESLLTGLPKPLYQWTSPKHFKTFIVY